VHISLYTRRNTFKTKPLDRQKMANDSTPKRYWVAQRCSVLNGIEYIIYGQKGFRPVSH